MLKNLLLIAAALLVCDLLAAQIAHLVKPIPEPDWYRSLERTYRVSHPVYHHELKPNTSATGAWGGQLYPVHVNSLGFRDRAVREVPLESDRWRILLLGDSVTEGTGVAYPSSFAGLVEAEFSRRGIEILNAAAGSYAPSIYFRKTQYLIEDVGLDFDEAVVFLDISDTEDEAKGYELDQDGNVAVVGPAPKGRRPGAPGPMKHFLKRHSVLVRFVDAVKDRIRSASGWRGPLVNEERRLTELMSAERSAWTFDDLAFEKFGRRGLEEAAQRMNRLEDLLREHGKTLTVVVYPWPAQILAGDLESRQVRFWRGWARERETPFVDLFPEFLGAGDPWNVLESYYIPWDSHFNEAGHRHLANAFLNSFRPARASR
jgi:hypothetical protein